MAGKKKSVKKTPAKAPEPIEDAAVETLVIEAATVETDNDAVESELTEPVSARAAEAAETYSSEELERSAIESPAPKIYDEEEDEEEGSGRRERTRPDFSRSKLSWLVDDFEGVTSSVYEAVMISAHRARQIGRLQKREIDAYNTAQPLTPESIEAEEHAEKGIDHFHHIKPTIAAMDELRKRMFEYYYLEDKK